MFAITGFFPGSMEYDFAMWLALYRPYFLAPFFVLALWAFARRKA